MANMLYTHRSFSILKRTWVATKRRNPLKSLYDKGLQFYHITQYTYTYNTVPIAISKTITPCGIDDVCFGIYPRASSAELHQPGREGGAGEDQGDSGGHQRDSEAELASGEGVGEAEEQEEGGGSELLPQVARGAQILHHLPPTHLYLLAGKSIQNIFHIEFFEKSSKKE